MLQGLFDTKNVVVSRIYAVINQFGKKRRRVLVQLMRTCSEPDVRVVIEEELEGENFQTALVNRFSLEILDDDKKSSSNSLECVCVCAVSSPREKTSDSKEAEEEGRTNLGDDVRKSQEQSALPGEDEKGERNEVAEEADQDEELPEEEEEYEIGSE